MDAGIGRQDQRVVDVAQVMFLGADLFEILPLIAVATNSAFREDELSFGNYIEILLSKFFFIVTSINYTPRR